MSAPGEATSPGVPGNAFEGVTALLPADPPRHGVRGRYRSGRQPDAGAVRHGARSTWRRVGASTASRSNTVNQTSQTTTFISA